MERKVENSNIATATLPTLVQASLQYEHVRGKIPPRNQADPNRSMSLPAKQKGAKQNKTKAKQNKAKQSKTKQNKAKKQSTKLNTLSKQQQNEKALAVPTIHGTESDETHDRQQHQLWGSHCCHNPTFPT